nr:immunoglobulin light chain junction region [Mus musculus]NSL97092.1 immunoglobulin light chain junction region [Mus musculus]NSL97166.1 immunoglobulin light chain junction region [Mus musculus]NSL97176.1 immunoglobulin light chain junction region [Mus musculus]NSL97189.1 immunoglobulin light chain junction region [Mus musculus]
CLQSDNMPYTF